MGLLEGKNALVFGLANKDSIAWGITQAFHREGAKIGLSYAIPQLEKRIFPLAESLGIDFVRMADANSDTDLDRLFTDAGNHFGGRIDIVVHAIAFAPREDLSGNFSDISRDGFKIALETSAYSLIAITRRAIPYMTDGGSIMTLTYYAAEKVTPKYNVMAMAKAALECAVRYLAAELGQQRIRVNAISAGPIKTLAASGIQGFRTMLKYVEQAAPLRTLVSQDDVGNTAAWLASDWATMVTGEVLHVDGGYHAMGTTMTEEQRREYDMGG